MKHFASRELFAYWNRLRGERSAPERGDIDPAAIRAVLASTFVLEVAGAPEARALPFRLSGTRLNALVTRELKGHSLLSLFDAGQHGAVNAVVDTVLDDQVAVVAGLRAAPAGLVGVDLELLLLPLRHHGRTHSRILGALSPCHSPSWLGLLPVEALTLVSFRIIDAPGAAALPLVQGAVAERLLAGERWGAAPPCRPGRMRFTVHQGGRQWQGTDGL